MLSSRMDWYPDFRFCRNTKRQPRVGIHFCSRCGSRKLGDRTRKQNSWLIPGSLKTFCDPKDLCQDHWAKSWQNEKRNLTIGPSVPVITSNYPTSGIFKTFWGGAVRATGWNPGTSCVSDMTGAQYQGEYVNKRRLSHKWWNIAVVEEAVDTAGWERRRINPRSTS